MPLLFKLSEELSAVVVNPLGLLTDDEELKQNFSATEISFQMPKATSKSFSRRREPQLKVRILKVPFSEREESPSSDLETTTAVQIATTTKYEENKDQIFDLLKSLENYPKKKTEKISKASRWQIHTYKKEIIWGYLFPEIPFFISEFQWCNAPQDEELKCCSHRNLDCGSFQFLDKEDNEVAKLKGLKVPEIHSFPKFYKFCNI
eukprot:GHVP01017149.1.p1 GENE.GHVP01017149.1~~GHVP01017149.1.p1  ORF type:complete len:237 (-),score=26.52 GHVP01017149.1:32-646(-)